MRVDKNKSILQYFKRIHPGRVGGMILLTAGLLCGHLFAAAPSVKGKGPPQRIVQNVLGRPASTLMNINNIAMWVRDDGLMERRPQDLNAGTTFPRGTSTFVY